MALPSARLGGHLPRPDALRIWKDIDPFTREVTAFHAQWQQSAETPMSGATEAAMKRLSSVAALLIAGNSTLSGAQQNQSTARAQEASDLHILPVRGNVYMLVGTMTYLLVGGVFPVLVATRTPRFTRRPHFASHAKRALGYVGPVYSRDAGSVARRRAQAGVRSL